MSLGLRVGYGMTIMPPYPSKMGRPLTLRGPGHRVGLIPTPTRWPENDCLYINPRND